MRHEIRGRVVDQFTGDGIGGVRVEAWDKDFLAEDFLGFARHTERRVILNNIRRKRL